MNVNEGYTIIETLVAIILLGLVSTMGIMVFNQLWGNKAMLLKKDVIVNTQNGILKDFEEKYNTEPQFQYPGGFKEFVLRINKNEPGEEFAKEYLHDTEKFLTNVKAINELKEETVVA